MKSNIKRDWPIYVLILMATISGILLALYSPKASAGDWKIDLGVGYTDFREPDNGVWYQEEFPHTLDTQSPNAYIGLAYPLSDKLTLTAGYQYYGDFSSYALASSSDLNYAAYQAGEEDIWPLSTWIGDGRSQALKIGLEYEWRQNWLVSGGLMGVFTEWTMHVPDWRCATSRCSDACLADFEGAYPSSPRSLTVRHDSSAELSGYIGAGYKITEDLRVMGELFYLPQKNEYPAMARRWNPMINAVWRF